MKQALPKILLLLFLNTLIGGIFFFTYYREATGPLKSAIAAHAQALKEDTIPPANSIDIYKDDWTRLARFETVQQELGLIVNIAFSFFMTYILITCGISGAMAAWCRCRVKNVHLQRALYLALFSIIFAIISIPDSIYVYLTGLLRGTSTETVDLAVWDAISGLFLSLIGVLIANIPFYFIMDKFRRAWWVVAALFMSLLSALVVFAAPVVLDPLSNTYTPLSEGHIREEITALVQRAGVHTDQIYVMDASTRTLESNAQVTGFLSTARVVLDDTLLRHYSDREILFIVAHELGHYVHHDVVTSLWINIVETFIFLFALYLLLRSFVRRFGKRLGVSRESDIVLYPLLAFVLAILPLLTGPLDAAIGRSLEHRADAYALALTGDPQAAIDGFKKLSYEAFADPDPPALLEWWFGDHPTIAERIAYLETSEAKAR